MITVTAMANIKSVKTKQYSTGGNGGGDCDNNIKPEQQVEIEANKGRVNAADGNTCIAGPLSLT